jgi:holo-[acyl-carrier protein] synthase
MIAIGVDIIEIERVAQTITRFGDRFLRRVYTERELSYCQGRVGSLAARWAAKEAVAKALGTGIGDVSWQEIEIINDARQTPAIHLHGAAADLAGRLDIAGFAVSLSHAKDYAVAFVIAEKSLA